MAKSGSVERGALGIFKFMTWVVYAIAIAAMIVLAFGFVLLIFAAKPTAGFAEFVYHLGSDFMDPFKGMITPTKLSNGGVIAWSMLVAIAAYAVLAWVLGMILDAVSRAIYKTRRTPTPPTIASIPVQSTGAGTEPPAVTKAPPAAPAPPTGVEPSAGGEPRSDER